MVTLIIIHLATRLARFGRKVGETWRETQRLRRSLAGPMRSSKAGWGKATAPPWLNERRWRVPAIPSNVPEGGHGADALCHPAAVRNRSLAPVSLNNHDRDYLSTGQAEERAQHSRRQGRRGMLMTSPRLTEGIAGRDNAPDQRPAAAKLTRKEWGPGQPRYPEANPAARGRRAGNDETGSSRHSDGSVRRTTVCTVRSNRGNDEQAGAISAARSRSG